MSLLPLLSASLQGSGLALTDFFWDARMFQKEQWEPMMTFLRLTLTLGGAIFLIAEARARKLSQPLRKRTTRRIAITLTVLAFLSYFDFFNPHTRYPDYYHRHEFFHYYLGAKYNQELGYLRLYECTAVAEVDLGRRAAVASRELRDLRVNLIKPVKDTYVFSNPGECRDRFTPERWEAFKKDVDWFYSVSRGGYWENMQKDHGYNPPPVWTMTGKLFASFGPAGDGFFKLLASIDILLHIGTIALLWWAFGWRVGMVGAVFWGVNGPANFYWTGGAFLRQDWLFLFVASVCCLRKRKFALAGAALTWSSLLRVFPIITFAGWAIVIGIHIFKRILAYRAGEKRPARWLDAFLTRDHQRLIAGCLVAAGLLIPASVVVAGPNSYREFVMHTLKTHSHTPLTNTMGLETMLVHTWDGRMRFGRNDNLDDPFQEWKQGRLDRFQADKPYFFLIVGLVGAWTVWALRRTKLLWVASALSLPLTMCLTNLTCYYYSNYMIGAVLIMAAPTFGPAFLAVSGASYLILQSFYWVDDKFVAMSYLYFLLSLLMLYVYSRPFSFKRLYAWIAGKPEPREGPVVINTTP